jgi:hypothetical protein
MAGRPAYLSAGLTLNRSRGHLLAGPISLDYLELNALSASIPASVTGPSAPKSARRLRVEVARRFVSARGNRREGTQELSSQLVTQSS